MNRRLQALLIFFIDGASFIALDGNWSYFLVYSENKVLNQVMVIHPFRIR
jgi:hypothetical protein